MPLIQKTVYVREADIEKWNALPNKAEFIHNALYRDVGARVKHLDKQLARVETMAVDNLEAQQLRPIKTKQDAAKVVKEVFPDAKPIEPVTYKKTSNWGA